MGACTPPHSVEMEHIDALRVDLAENATTLHLDISIFESRVKEINGELDTLAKHYTDTITLDLGRELDKYKALRKIYDKQISTYHFCVKEQMELETQLAHLETDLVNGNMGKQEFKNHLRTERSDIEALLSKSQDVKNRLYEVEPEYLRLSKKVKEMIASMN